MKIQSVIRKFQKEADLGPVQWYFNTPCVRWGVAKDGQGNVWRLDQDKAQMRVTCRLGRPEHFSMTPQLLNGLRKAMEKIGASL